MMPAVPGMDSSMIAAIVAGPSRAIDLLEVGQRALALLLPRWWRENALR